MLTPLVLQARNSEKKPSDYLVELPPVPPSRLEVRLPALPSFRRSLASSLMSPIARFLSPQGDELLEAELRRAAAGTPLAALDLQRYNLNPPPASQRGDPAAWQAALDNAHAQLEHQRNRLLNLELLLKFGPNSWRAHNEALASHVMRVQGQAAEAAAAVEDLNRERKLQQTAAGRELRALEAEYLSLVAKNVELQGAVERAEAEVAALGGGGGDEQ